MLILALNLSQIGSTKLKCRTKSVTGAKLLLSIFRLWGPNMSSWPDLSPLKALLTRSYSDHGSRLPQHPCWSHTVQPTSFLKGTVSSRAGSHTCLSLMPSSAGLRTHATGGASSWDRKARPPISPILARMRLLHSQISRYNLSMRSVYRSKQAVLRYQLLNSL